MGVCELLLPVPADGAGDVAAFVGGDVDVHLHEANLWVVQVLGCPLGIYQHLGMSVVVSHGSPPDSVVLS